MCCLRYSEIQNKHRLLVIRVLKQYWINISEWSIRVRDSCISGPKYCPMCRRELEPYAKSCGFCGTELNSNKIVKVKKIKKYYFKKMSVYLRLN